MRAKIRGRRHSARVTRRKEDGGDTALRKIVLQASYIGETTQALLVCHTFRPGILIMVSECYATSERYDGALQLLDDDRRRRTTL